MATPCPRVDALWRQALRRTRQFPICRPCRILITVAAIVGLLAGGANTAKAQCAIPYTLTNGQNADATQVMADINALVACLGTGANFQLTGPGGGAIMLQNPSATSNYNFNLPAAAGSTGSLLTSGGGISSPMTWTSVGTSGHVLPFLNGSNTWSGTQTFGPVVGAVSTQAGTTYTLAATDCGKTLRFTSATAVTVTTLSTIPAGCAIAIEQAGAGQVTIIDGTGSTHHSAHAFTKTFAQYAILGLFVDVNSGGSAANYIISGDGA